MLTDEQYANCQQEQPNITVDGVLSTMAYSQRTLQQAYAAILNGSPPGQQLQLGLLDPLFFYQFRIYQLLQTQIISQLNQLTETLLQTLTFIYEANAVFLAGAVGYFAWYALQERRKNHRRYCYLLSFPATEFRNNKHIKRYVAQLTEQSLF